MSSSAACRVCRVGLGVFTIGVWAWPGAVGGAQTPVTYTETIAPILIEHCVPCHRPGGIGPFSLLDYDAAR